MDDINKKSLSDDEIQQTANLLKKLKPGFLPFDIFAQIARLTVLPVVEIMPFRKKGGVIEILLTKRRGNDKYWPSLWHVPGTVIRGDDAGLEQAFSRVLDKELKNIKASTPKLVESALRNSERGRESAQIFWINVTEEPDVGKFFDIKNLPDNIIKSQVEYIKSAAKQFRAKMQ